MVSVVIGILTVGAGYFGARAGADANLTGTREQVVAQDQKEIRVKRGEVYANFLEVANAYSVESYNFIRDREIDLKDNGRLDAKGPELGRAVGTYQHARYEFQGAINDVYVYGSDEAWTASKAVSAALPPSLGTVDSSVQIQAPKYSVFTAAYQKFINVMCGEVVPVPRSGCARIQ